VKGFVIDGLAFEEATGDIRFNQVRYMLIRPETLIAIQKTMEEATGVDAGNILFQGGLAGGRLSGRRFRKNFEQSEEDYLRFFAKMGTSIGWGHFRVLSCDIPRKKFSFSVKNSPFVGSYGQSSNPVCHILRGVLAGLGESMFAEAMEAKESSCAAMGNGECVFQVQPAS
jgi:predicted hydrocarbon binding protein